MSKNEEAWEKIFDALDVIGEIERHGFADVTSAQIKKIANREPRLIAKVDHAINESGPFRENGLSLLTISRSCYRIGPFEIFAKIRNDINEFIPPSSIGWHNNLESLSMTGHSGEPGVLHIAFASGVLQNFFGEEVIPTISGRMSTGAFSFSVKNRHSGYSRINVDRAQIEIDAGYEGKNGVYLIEAKNHSANDFNIRQLYYPYRVWKEKVSKRISSIYLTYSNDIFTLSEFEFQDPDSMSSILQVKQKEYILAHEKIDFRQLLEYAKFAKKSELTLSNDHGAPKPQADDFRRVVDIVSILIESPKSKNDLTSHYSFDPRQSDYYLNAATYLGLVEKVFPKVLSENGGSLYKSTSLANEIFKLPIDKKYFEIAKLVLSIPTVREIVLHHEKYNQLPSLDEVIQTAINNPDLREHAETTTLKRRAQTLLAWAKWVLSLRDL